MHKIGIYPSARIAVEILQWKKRTEQEQEKNMICWSIIDSTLQALCCAGASFFLNSTHEFNALVWTIFTFLIINFFSLLLLLLLERERKISRKKAFIRIFLWNTHKKKIFGPARATYEASKCGILSRICIYIHSFFSINSAFHYRKANAPHTLLLALDSTRFIYFLRKCYVRLCMAQP